MYLKEKSLAKYLWKNGEGPGHMWRSTSLEEYHKTWLRKRNGSFETENKAKGEIFIGVLEARIPFLRYLKDLGNDTSFGRQK